MYTEIDFSAGHVHAYMERVCQNILYILAKGCRTLKQKQQQPKFILKSRSAKRKSSQTFKQKQNKKKQKTSGAHELNQKELCIFHKMSAVTQA